MAIKTHTIKVTARTHNMLRRNAFKKRKPIYQILEELLGLADELAV